GERQGRGEERQGVGGEGNRGREQLDERAAEARPDHARERPASLQEGIRLDVPLARHEHHEERGVEDEEEDTEQTGREADHVQLREGQHPERVRDRDAGERGGAPQIGDDHHPAAPAVAVDPRAAVQREEQVREQCDGDQVAHLGRRRVERENCDERQGDQRDLVADQRDRLAGEERPDLAVVPEQPRDEPHARTILMSPLIVAPLTSTSGPPVATSTPPSSTSEIVSPLSDFASTKRREPCLIPMWTSPDADLTSTEPSPMEPMCMSPEAVFSDTRFAASAIWTSPDADLIVLPPAAEPTWTSPEAVFTSALPPPAPSWTSPLADRTLASRSTSSTCTSPDAVFTSIAPRRPVARK